MDNLASIAKFLDKLTIFVNDRYYLKQLDTSELTSARNMLLELMLQTDAPNQRKELITTAQSKLAEKGITVREEHLLTALKMISVGNAK